MQNISFRIDPTVSIMVSVLKQINMTLFVVGIIIWHYQDPMMIYQRHGRRRAGEQLIALSLFKEEESPLAPYFYSLRCPRMILRAPKLNKFLVATLIETC